MDRLGYFWVLGEGAREGRGGALSGSGMDEIRQSVLLRGRGGPGAGLAWMTYRHFHPHWDASHAVPHHAPPAFGTPQLARMER